MPFTTGVARTPSELINALNTHLVANGWTKVRGDTDMNCASPKAARYWRLVIFETQNTGSTTRGIGMLHLRTTLGGANVATNAANWSVSDIATGTTAVLISGGTFRGATSMGQSRSWKMTYDFGTPTTIRELYLRGDATVNNSPRAFSVQWSNDGDSWTTMYEASGLTWTASENKTFSFGDGYLFSNHVSGVLPRRSGGSEDYAADTNWEGSVFRDFSDDIFVWQGPGYDASRRVYISARGHTNVPNLTHLLEFNYSTNFNPAVKSFLGQEGSAASSVFHVFGSGSVNYWIYTNSHRIILVTQTGSADYTSTYIGFMGAFALPDYYPFPLLAVSTASNRDYTSNVANNGLSSIADPGYGALWCKKWDGLNSFGGNRNFGATEGLSASGSVGPFPMVWPCHFGSSDTNQRWPTNKGGNTQGSLYTNQHLFEFLVATQQTDLPLFPCVIFDRTHGNLGVMTGVFALPGGGILAPQQVLVIGGQNYRVFPNRTRRQGVSWFAVKED